MKSTLAWTLGLALAWTGLAVAQEPGRPRLVVFMVVDQLRADAIERYRADLLPPLLKNGRPGGLRFLRERGLNFHQFYLDSLPTHTAVGHACLSSGADPCVHGIVGNQWYEPATGRYRESVDDDKDGVSPRLLQTSTLGDELKLANQGRSKVFGVAVKSRSAVLLAGHKADGAYWIDSKQGGWTTSSYYRQTPQQRQNLLKFNQNGFLEKHRHWTWTPLLAPESYHRSNSAKTGQIISPASNLEEGVDNLQPNPKPNSVEGIVSTPLGFRWTLDLARHLVELEALGQDEAPDVLWLSFSSYDKIGHACGPYSPQLQDALARLDRDLADFLGYLQDRVGLDHVVLVLTADHGAAPIPEQRDLGGLHRRGTTKDIAQRLDAELERRLGGRTPQTSPARQRSKTAGSYLLNFTEPHLVIDHLGLEPAQISGVAENASQILGLEPSVQAAWTQDAILQGRLPRIPLAEQVSRSFYPGRSGDVFVVQRPFWVYSFNEQEGTSHGAPWTYDSQIPLMVVAPRVGPAISRRRYFPKDLVTSLSEMLRVCPPAGCFGQVMSELR